MSNKKRNLRPRGDSILDGVDFQIKINIEIDVDASCQKVMIHIEKIEISIKKIKISIKKIEIHIEKTKIPLREN